MALRALHLPSIASAEPAAVAAGRREVQLSRLLMAWISLGLIFMLLPGTFLGVWNLISIASRRAAESVAPAWIQAHGHAQVFGWIASFIFGIGFYSLPKLLRGRQFPLWRAWACLAFWTAGVGLRWTANVYAWHWRLMLPLSAMFEIIAFGLFFRAVTGHDSSDKAVGSSQAWISVVVAGSVGFMLALLANLGACFYLAVLGSSPAFPAWMDQRYLVLMTWGFLVPFVWGFSARWLPVFLGLQGFRPRLLAIAVASNSAGVVAALTGKTAACVALLLCGSVLAVLALRIFNQRVGSAKVRGIHASFPDFVRSAYVWLIVAATLAVWAAQSRNAAGIWGASRHALTVGFLSMMVFSIGQRILPAFSGMHHLFSSRLMFASTALLTVGCAMRVASEILAYTGVTPSAWFWLPVSALLELSAVTIFAANLWASFAKPAPPVVCG